MSMIGPAHPNYDYNRGRKIIGLSGYARAGKDTTADILEDYGYTRFAFADHLRKCLYILNPIITSNYSEKGMFPTVDGFTTLQLAIDEYGWDGYKTSPYSDEIRRLLQVMGTEVGREQIMDDIWVRELDKMDDNLVITDLRFPNEYDKIKSLGGSAWRITRPGIDAVNAHKSEKAIDHLEFDYNVDNSGDMEHLRGQVQEGLRYLGL